MDKFFTWINVCSQVEKAAAILCTSKRRTDSGASAAGCKKRKASGAADESDESDSNSGKVTWDKASWKKLGKEARRLLKVQDLRNLKFKCAATVARRAFGTLLDMNKVDTFAIKDNWSDENEMVFGMAQAETESVELYADKDVFPKMIFKIKAKDD